jgi:hypothetical protein
MQEQSEKKNLPTLLLTFTLAANMLTSIKTADTEAG